MEITLNRQSFKKALGVFLVVALFFGMCSPAAPYLPKISFDVGAANVTDGNVTDGNIEDVKPSGRVIESGNCGEVCFDSGMALPGSNLKYRLYENGVLVISGAGAMYDPSDVLGGYGGFGMFYANKRIKHVIIENGATSISYEAFDGCTSLKSIEIPDSVKTISYGAFHGCTSLESVKLSENLQEIIYDCFSGCTSLKSIEIPDSVKTIGYRAFRGCTNLKSIEIPDSVTSIGSDTFKGCTSLESVKLSKNLTYLPASFFSGCISLRTIEISDSVEAIGSYAFEGCTSLETVKFNEGLEFIGDSAFERCYSLKDANLPSTVKTIGSSAFNACIYLEEVTIPKSVTSIGKDLFTNCIRLSKVTVMNPDCEILYDKETLPEKAIIYGYSDSTAEKYATDWMRKFVPLDREHDHEFESKLTLKPTCSATGTEEYTCYCGECYTEVVPANSHFDVNKDDNCDMCGVKLNAFDQPLKPDEDENGGTTEAPEGDSGSAQEPEEEKNVVEKFFESMVGFFKKFANIFDFFKDLF